MFWAYGAYDESNHDIEYWANSNLLWSSVDGVTWTKHDLSLEGSIYNEWLLSQVADIKYGNGIYVALTYAQVNTDVDTVTADLVWTSPDGIHWSLNEKPLEIGVEYHYDRGLIGFSFIDGLFHAFRGNGEIQTSADGIEWENKKPIDLGSLEYKQLGWGVFLNGRQFLLDAYSRTVFTSTDGSNWEEYKNTSGIVWGIPKSYGNGLYVTSSGKLFGSSIYGKVWDAHDIPVTFNDIAFDGDSFVAVDWEGNIWESLPVTNPNPDTIPPVTNYAVDPIWDTKQGAKYIKGYTVSLTATDSGSGVKQTFYRINGGDWIQYTKPFVYSGGTATSIDFYSVDNAGNIEAHN